ncbi:hypothetical protein HOT99_gp048 [Caulobacter phage CcrBL10]|uniref:Uncharacterized protein n=1 Tax=Caulobacter phage CcrBL10 TaxID=2283269 RepID=A0A385EBK7_9CAUD|nr:hypothetical protein HOT99_gp048 [Caulobacter phage CcrBL10]AXQ68252.1 hypothetical protein CcrBL10_gp048 [Caulobacter phage CcrBL10]
MCVVSAVMDHGRQQWPHLMEPKFWPLPTPVVPAHPGMKIWPPQEPKLPTKAEIEAFLALYKAAQEYDAKTGQPHCEDPEKIKLLDAITRLADRLEAIEKRLGAQDAAEAEDAAAIAASVKT